MPTEREKIKNIMRSRIGAFRFEGERIGRNVSLVLSGVRSVADYSDVEMLLHMECGSIKICGVSLSISIFENKSIRISGRIRGIEFI